MPPRLSFSLVHPLPFRPNSKALTTMSTPTPPSFKLALLQLPVTSDKSHNLSTARHYLSRARHSTPSLAILPECFNSPYDTACFRRYAEHLPDVGATLDSAHDSPSLRMLQEEAVKHPAMYIVGGSVPEVDQHGRVYNSSMTVSPQGVLVAKHRKLHLFDIDVPGGIKFTESDVLSAGDGVTVFEAPALDCNIGVGICYDVRFAELAMLMTRRHAVQLLVYPGAFNMTTGPMHWELLMRARALDNQVYVVGCSPARDEAGGYVAWGHSMLVDPWGKVLLEAGAEPDVLIGEVGLAQVAAARRAIPVGKQRRDDIYKLQCVGEGD